MDDKIKVNKEYFEELKRKGRGLLLMFQKKLKI